MATKDVTVDGPVSLSSESTSPGPLDTNQEKPSVQETEEKAVVSEESPAETESQKETEFKEGGYGWFVVKVPSYGHFLPDILTKSLYL